MIFRILVEMKLKLIYYFLLGTFSLLTLCYSCTAIIEPSIKNSQEKLEAPFNGYQTSTYSVGFWWDEVPNAINYRLQIVTQNFQSPGSLILDSLISGTKFNLSLTPGTYQWRVSAQNGSSNTAFTSPNSFTIFSSSIAQQTVLLSSPANNTLTNQSVITFSWGTLFGAQNYRLEIDTNNFQNQNSLVYNQLTSGTQINYTFLKDQVYQWRVRGESDSTQSLWSTVNLITYDHTPPGQVSISSPTNNQTVSLPVSLQWNSVATAKQYKLYVFQSDSTTIYNSSFPITLSTTNYSFNFGSSGNRVYWKVSAIDAAGNEGQASTLTSFVLQ